MPQLQLKLHNTNYTTTTTTTTAPLHYNYNYSCTTPHYIQQFWGGDHCNHCSHSKKHKSNHLFGPSVASLCHSRFTITNLFHGFPIFETSATALCGTTGAQRNFCTQKSLHRSIYTDKSLKQRNFYTENAFAKRSLYTENAFTH